MDFSHVSMKSLGLIEVLDENSARHTFARVGFWVHPSKDQDGWGSHSLPNVAIIKDALATPFPPVPSLEASDTCAGINGTRKDLG